MKSIAHLLISLGNRPRCSKERKSSLYVIRNAHTSPLLCEAGMHVFRKTSMDIIVGCVLVVFLIGSTTKSYTNRLLPFEIYRGLLNSSSQCP